ncbi:MAG: hypothetical protein CR967_04520 [Proteobacteria bacterium]|nr:MAG: hypothetical protein CR967_04520 [Pseudomonadota bacterium]
MKKVILGVIMVLGLCVNSFSVEIGKSKWFIGIFCENRELAKHSNIYLMRKIQSGVNEDLIKSLEKEVNSSDKKCFFMFNENIKFNVFKKTKDWVTLKGNRDKILVHNALVSIISINGKKIGKLLKEDEKMSKILSKKKLWISRPYVNGKVKKAMPLLTFSNGKTW